MIANCTLTIIYQCRMQHKPGFCLGNFSRVPEFCLGRLDFGSVIFSRVPDIWLGNTSYPPPPPPLITKPFIFATLSISAQILLLNDFISLIETCLSIHEEYLQKSDKKSNSRLCKKKKKRWLDVRYFFRISTYFLRSQAPPLKQHTPFKGCSHKKCGDNFKL